MEISKIPDFPKIRLYNYISKLSDKSIIILKESIISEFIDDKILKKISSKLMLSKSTFKKYVENKRYPLFVIKEIDSMINKDLCATIEKNNPSCFSKWKIVKLPNFINPKLAYFVGYLQGDGSIESNEYRINFSDEYVEQIQRINQISIELFGIKGRIESKRAILSKKPMYRLEINSIALNSYLHNIFKINRGIKRNLKIPKLLMKNRDILKWYLIGLFDADGSLPKEPTKCKQLFIDVTFKDKEFIKQLKGILDSFKVKTLKPYCRIAKSPNSDFISKTWELRIRKKDDMVKFLKLIGFSHPSKRVRAEKMLKFLGQ